MKFILSRKVFFFFTKKEEYFENSKFFLQKKNLLFEGIFFQGKTLNIYHIWGKRVGHAKDRF